MLCYKLLTFVLFIPCLGFASEEGASIRQCQAHLLIGDVQTAVQTARCILNSSTADPCAYEWLIRSLAASGEDNEMIKVWEKMNAQFEERAHDQDLLEEMCWGVLKKGKDALGLSSQLICLIGAALGHDMRAVPFILDGLRHSNAQLREIAVELGAHYGDHLLREELSRMFQEEPVLDVRLAVIQAIGKLQMEEHLTELIQCVANPKTGPREKLAVIEAIVMMCSKLGKEELQVLARAKRAGLRELACEVIAHCNMEQEADLLIPLMQDPQPEVCAAAIRTWGHLRCPATEEIKKWAYSSLNPDVGVTAAWAWMLDDPVEGSRAMLKWIEHDQPHVRAFAASAVGAAGSYGVPLAKQMIEVSKDSYVRANLAIGLAGQREECEKVCAVLEESAERTIIKSYFLHTNS